ncbi:MAG: hypothetical protein ABI867_23740 [Kofleriaceae bacterium]
MSRTLFCLAFASFVLTSCTTNNGGDDDDDDPGTDAGPGPGPGPNDVAPKAGGWHYAEVTPVSNTCPANTPTGENGNFLIDQVGATSFRVVPNDGTPAFTCTLAAGGAFDCPNRAAAVQDLRPGIDAVITALATADGVFAAATRGNGGQTVDVTCAGTQCNLAGTGLPCRVAVDFRIEAL